MKPQKAEIIRSWDVVFPNDANPLGTMFGGKMMAVMDKIAAIAASHYSGTIAVTASTDAIDFKRPVKVGDRILVEAKVVWVGRTSMVVKVNAYAENPRSRTCEHCTTAHFTFVALDPEGRPTPVPPIWVETEEEKRDYQEAEMVKRQALERRQRFA